MLSSYPKILKYTIGDRPYFLSPYAYAKWPYTWFGNGRGRGFVKRCMVTGWRCVVTSPDGGTTGSQENYYTVKEIIGYLPADVSNNSPDSFEELYSTSEFEISESKLFSSPNHLIGVIGGKYLNYSCNGDNNANQIFSRSGKNWEDRGLGMEDWVDWACMDFRNGVLTDLAFHPLWVGGYIGGEEDQLPTLITDGCNFTGASMPTGLTTKSNFRSYVFSYDENTTIWTNGSPIGRS